MLVTTHAQAWQQWEEVEQNMETEQTGATTSLVGPLAISDENVSFWGGRGLKCHKHGFPYSLTSH